MVEPQTSLAAVIARNRAEQRRLYGAPLGERISRLTAVLGISQARLARTIGVSPGMLSQWATGRRIKIGDPAVLARLLLLDQRSRGFCEPPPPDRVEALLDDVSVARWQWAGTETRSATRSGSRSAGPGGTPDRPGAPAAALRRVAAPARLAAAAAALGPRFPELAELLRQAAAARPVARPVARPSR